MASHRRFEDPKWRSHVYRMRYKHGGWYGRRFGKNPRHANQAMDAFRQEQRKKKK